MEIGAALGLLRLGKTVKRFLLIEPDVATGVLRLAYLKKKHII